MDDEYAYDTGWWNEPPWSEDINGALHEFELREGVSITLLGGPNGFEKIVRLVLKMHRSVDTRADLAYPYGELPVPLKDGETYTYLDSRFDPLQGWTVDEMQEIVKEAHEQLLNHDETYRVARVLREAITNGPDTNIQSAGVSRKLPDQAFITIYNIVSQRYGYANIMARLLNYSPQTVMNRVRSLTKAGLIEKKEKK